MPLPHTFAVTVNQLVEAVVTPTEPAIDQLEIFDFIPRPPRIPTASNGPGGNRRRYSSESRKVGEAGERAVEDFERHRLLKLGRADLAARIENHASKGEFVGWDITSFGDEGNKIYIEVKSSVGRQVFGVCITANEWAAANDPDRRGRYFIYIVTNALSVKPKIERLHNPAEFVQAGRLRCEPASFDLWLMDPIK